MSDLLAKKRSVVRRVILYGVVVIFLVYQWPRSCCAGLIKTLFVDYAQKYHIQEGDLVFQNLSGRLLEVIADVTQSPYTHCGIVVKKTKGYYVLEAIGPVKETPFNSWVAQGLGQKITIVRFKEELQPYKRAIIVKAYSFFGRPYDSRYRWDDENIYCSELIYKAVYLATGISLAKLDRLGDLHWQPHERFIRQLDGGTLPLDRKMITPVSLVLSDKVCMVYSNFKTKGE